MFLFDQDFDFTTSRNLTGQSPKFQPCYATSNNKNPNPFALDMSYGWLPLSMRNYWLSKKLMRNSEIYKLKNVSNLHKIL